VLFEDATFGEEGVVGGEGGEEDVEAANAKRARGQVVSGRFEGKGLGYVEESWAYSSSKISSVGKAFSLPFLNNASIILDLFFVDSPPSSFLRLELASSGEG